MIGGYLEILFLKQNNVCRRLQIGLKQSNGLQLSYDPSDCVEHMLVLLEPYWSLYAVNVLSYPQPLALASEFFLIAALIFLHLSPLPTNAGSTFIVPALMLMLWSKFKNPQSRVQHCGGLVF
jgi:hypothetical protein